MLTCTVEFDDPAEVKCPKGRPRRTRRPDGRLDAALDIANPSSVFVIFIGRAKG